ncbi:MAG: hypothetical protein CSA94_01990, partial [Bacteroidetes bacterium]
MFVITQSEYLQTALTERVVGYLSNHYDLNVSIDNVEMKLPNKLKLDGFFIPNEQGDTLFYSKEILAKVSDINFRSKQIFIREVLIDEPDIRVQSDSTGRMNFQFILEKFASDKEKKKKDKASKEEYDIFCESFKFQNANLQFQNNPFSETPGSFNSSDIFTEGFTINVSNFKMQDDSISLNLDELSFREKSGLTLENMSAGILITDTVYRLNDLIVKTENSLLHAPALELAILDTAMNDVWNDIMFNVNLKSSVLSSKDAAYLVPDLKGLNEKVTLSAILKGKLSDIKLEDFTLAHGRDTRLRANLKLNGLPKLDETFVFGNVAELRTTVNDVQSIYLPPFKDRRTLELPENVQKLEYVHFNGEVVGMFNDLVANGRFTTKHGTVNTDLALVSNFKQKEYKFKG